MQQLTDAQGLLRLAADLGRLGAWSIEVGADKVIWSDEVCAIHEVRAGYAPTLAEALAFYPRDQKDHLEEVFLGCLEHGKPYDEEFEIVTRGGRRAWVRCIGTAERDEQGTIVRVNGAFQDISKAKAAQARVRELADRLTMTLESISDGFLILDRTWRVEYINSFGERLLQRDRHALLGKVIWEEFPDAVGSHFHREYERCMVEHVPVEFESYYEALAMFLQVRAYPSAQGIAVAFRDITDSVRTQEEILRLNAELEDRVKRRTAALEAARREMESFSYSVAHDLRSPLASINGYSRALEEMETEHISARGRHFLGRIRAATLHMEQLTEGLLALAHLSRATLRRERFDLSSMALAMLSSMAEQDPTRQVEIDIAPGLVVDADAVLLTQVMQNLLGNAWKFTSKKGVGRISVGCESRAGEPPVYFVRDNGAGFDMAYASKLFAPFHRLHSMNEFEGTGVGLATVSKIVTLHGGRIWVDAVVGEGACFRFTLADRLPDLG